MKNLDNLHTFKYYSLNKRFREEDVWQYAPLQMIYAVKQHNLRRKARLVIGGHVIDSSMHKTYSSNMFQ